MVSNGIDFDAWLLFLLMINDFMKYSNSMDFHFACGQGNGYYWCEHTSNQELVFAITALWLSWWRLTQAYPTNVRNSWELLHLGGCWIYTATLRLVDECWKSCLQLGMPTNVYSKWVISSYPSPYIMLPLYWGCPWQESQLIAVSLMVWGWWKHYWSPI